MTEPKRPEAQDPIERERLKQQRRRSIAIALVLGAMVLIFYAATIVRLGGHVANRML